MSTLERIFIVGHPGAGKGLFAQSIAKVLGWKFVNADLELEHKVGRKLQDIIGDAGSLAYHKSQGEIIKHLQKEPCVVIATDGPILDGTNVPALFNNKKDYIVYLETSVETQLDRSQRNPASLLTGAESKELYNQLHTLRDHTFKKHCHLEVDGNHSDIDKQVSQVINAIKGEDLNREVAPILTAKDLTIFHNTTHEPVNISQQQAVCLKYLVRGLSAKETARKMDISHRTVEAHLAELKDKLGCDTIKEIIALYHNVV